MARVQSRLVHTGYAVRQHTVAQRNPKMNAALLAAADALTGVNTGNQNLSDVSGSPVQADCT